MRLTKQETRLNSMSNTIDAVSRSNLNYFEGLFLKNETGIVWVSLVYHFIGSVLFIFKGNKKNVPQRYTTYPLSI